MQAQNQHESSAPNGVSEAKCPNGVWQIVPKSMARKLKLKSKLSDKFEFARQLELPKIYLITARFKEVAFGSRRGASRGQIRVEGIF